MSRMTEIVQILKKNEIVHGLTPEKLKNILEDLGPTFIKFGQILSMRQDILPEEYCKALETLKSNVHPMDFETVLREVDQECGRPWQEVFSKIVEKPLGSASIAQVHRATLLNGDSVVIKIQRPGIKEIMWEDIRLCRRGLAILKVVKRDDDEVVELDTILDEIWESAQKEFDFLQEGTNLKRFYELNKDVEGVNCPKVYLDLTTSRMLVMEYVKGISVERTDLLKKKGYDLDLLGRRLAENYVKQVLEDAFFHADPHSGNIVVRDGQIVWIDLGMMGELSKRDRSLFTAAVEAIALGDIYELKDAILAIGEIHGEVDQIALYTDLDLFVSRYGKMDIKSMNLGEVFNDIRSLLQRYRIRLGRGLTMLIRGVITIESVVKDMSPNLDFMGVFRRYLQKRPVSLSSLWDELKIKRFAALHVLKKAVDMPGQVIDLIKMASHGQMKLNMQLSDSPEFVKNVNQIVNRLIIALIDAALLIASSLICLSDMKGQIFGIPALGCIGYFLAIVLGVYLVADTMRKRRG